MKQSPAARLCKLTTSPIQSGVDCEVTVGFTSTALVVLLIGVVSLTFSVVVEQAVKRKIEAENKSKRSLFLFKENINLNTRQG